MEKRGKIIFFAVIIGLGITIPLVLYFGVFGQTYGDGVVKCNPCDLDNLEKISKFRSCAGHAYPDDQDSSNKHYFRLLSTYYTDGIIDVKLYAPWDCLIVDIDDSQGEVSYGVQIHMRSGDYLGIFMHVEPLENITVGKKIHAGDWMGYCDIPYMESIGSFDFCIHKPMHAFQEPTYSCFALMDSTTFSTWNPYGITSLDQVIISAEERSNSPCTGWDAPENYVVLIH